MCEITACEEPLSMIESVCYDNFGSGTLGCFAKDEKGQKYYAITAQHVLSTAWEEKKEERYIFSNILNASRLDMPCQTVILSTESSGLQTVKLLGNRDKKLYYLDIAMMAISDSFDSVTCTEELKICNNIMKDEEVFKSGVETGETKGKFVTWAIVPHPLSEKEEPGCAFLVKSADEERPFAKPGDSGSLVYTKRDGKTHALGILAESTTDDTIYVCTYITEGIQALNEQFDVNLQLYDGLSYNTSGENTFISHNVINKKHCTCNNSQQT